MTRSSAISVIIIAAVAASFLRLPLLSVRPMHTDEAVHAVKFGKLLEQNEYRYDPCEYHGPTLNYFTLVPALLTGQTSFEQLSAATLRVVPAFFSILLVVLPVFLIGPLGPAPAAFGSILIALSPAFAFYGRYYIQETVFVAFTFLVIVAGWQYIRTHRPVWAILAGAALGLAFATKETFIIVLAALTAAAVLTLISMPAGRWTAVPAKIWRHILFALVAFVAVSAAFFSSFFTNPHGIIDSIQTYAIYFSRGGGNNTAHIHPWYYYLTTLAWFRLGSGPEFTELLILTLAVCGAVAAFRNKTPANASPAFCRFITFYSILLAVAYSVIPYKTPWCLLGFYHGFIILAGLGAWYILQITPARLKIAAGLVLTAGTLHMGWQAYAANFKYYAAPENPYVYAQTTQDVPDAARQIRSLAKAAGQQKNLPVEIIFPADDYWPFPWYLRGFEKVGYYDSVPLSLPAAPVIVASARVQDALMHRLYQLPPAGQKHLYIPLTEKQAQLRPGVPFDVYVRKDFYDRAMQNDAALTGDGK